MVIGFAPATTAFMKMLKAVSTSFPTIPMKLLSDRKVAGVRAVPADDAVAVPDLDWARCFPARFFRRRTKMVTAKFRARNLPRWLTFGLQNWTAPKMAP